MAVLHSAPRVSADPAALETLGAALGGLLVDAHEEHGELMLRVPRESIEDALRLLRDEHAYQQLIDIAGVDYPGREERFELVYILLSLTKNHRIMVKCSAAEDVAVPTVTTLWPNAGWLEREVFDMFGVPFDGNTDMRRILTDYGFEGHPFRKDFPLTGYHEVRYSEEAKRVIYEPVELAQDFRNFEFTSPWEGADYPLPGDEKATMPPVMEVKTTEKPIQTGAGPKTDAKAAEHVARGASGGTVAGQGQGEPVPEDTKIEAPGAPDPTEDRHDRLPREDTSPDTHGATQVEPRKSRDRDE